MINFTVTFDGLEEQLLNEVRAEQMELQHFKLHVSSL